MLAAEVVLKVLQAEKVEYVFGVVGSAYLDIIDAFHRFQEPKYICTQHEQGAVFMADGYARYTGRVGVCMATVGPGITNMVSGVAQAYIESSPMVVIAGDVHSKVYGKGRSNYHEVDQKKIFEPITKESFRVERADRLEEYLHRAFRVAQSGRKGPVYVGIARDVQREDVVFKGLEPEMYRFSGQIRSDANSVAKAAELLSNANNPFILVGGGARWSGAAQQVTELAEMLDAPIGVTFTDPGIIDGTHPLCVGIVGPSEYPGSVAITKADLILGVGTTFGERTTSRYGYKRIPKNAQIIQIDIDPEEIGKNYPVAVGLVGDAKAVLLDLTENLKSRGHGPVVAEMSKNRRMVQDLRSDWFQSYAIRAASDIVPMEKLRVIKDICEDLAPDAIIAGYGSWRECLMPTRLPALNRGEFGAIGSSMAMCLAAKLAYPERQVINICGDGAFLMIMQEVATAVKYHIPIVVAIVNNSIYGNMAYKQWEHFEGRVFGCDLPVPDLVQLAHSFGAYGEKVTEPSQIKPALRRAFESGLPAILDLVVSSDVKDAEIRPTSLEDALHLM